MKNKPKIGATVKNARAIIRDELNHDEELEQGYIDNISCILMDRVKGLRGISIKQERDRVSAEILRRLFYD